MIRSLKVGVLIVWRSLCCTPLMSARCEGRAPTRRLLVRALPRRCQGFRSGSRQSRRSTLAILGRVEREIASDGRDATHLAKDEKPHPRQPHRKTQVVAQPNAVAALLRQPRSDDLLVEAMRVQSRQTASFAEQLGDAHPAVDTAAVRRADQMMRGDEASIPQVERKRVSFYFAEGSQNMDDRGLASDGEAMLIVSGPQASAGLVDFFYMMARTTWVDRSSMKRLLRFLFDDLQSDLAFNGLLSTWPMRSPAAVLDFHHEGGFDPLGPTGPEFALSPRA
jgi:hypothetical protein